MVEFALTLPVLLLLIFGIIEFGRVLQAWLALENGARFAIRYAVTGNYNPSIVTKLPLRLPVNFHHGRSWENTYTKSGTIDFAAADVEFR